MASWRGCGRCLPATSLRMEFAPGQHGLHGQPLRPCMQPPTASAWLLHAWWRRMPCKAALQTPFPEDPHFPEAKPVAMEWEAAASRLHTRAPHMFPLMRCILTIGGYPTVLSCARICTSDPHRAETLSPRPGLPYTVQASRTMQQCMCQPHLLQVARHERVAYSRP